MDKIENELIRLADVIQQSVQIDIKKANFYARNVVKKEWPKTSDGFTTSILTDSYAGGYETEIRTFHLKQMAINSPEICLADLIYTDPIPIRHITECMKENLLYIWNQVFQQDLVNTIKDHSIAKECNLFRVDAKPRRINFFGKVISPYLNQGEKWSINPKYAQAAEQVILFDPDTVHFLFPDVSKWAGNIGWRNILNAETNPDGMIGYYRTVLRYAAKPVRPDLGKVITVVPPGFRGWLWYRAWKLVGFVP